MARKKGSDSGTIEVDPIKRAYATFTVKGITGLLRNRYQEGYNGPTPGVTAEGEADPAVEEKAAETKLPPAGGQKSKRPDKTPFEIAEGCSELMSDGPDEKLAKVWDITWRDHEKLFGFPGSGIKKSLWEVIRATNMKLTMTTAKLCWMVTQPVIPILTPDHKYPAPWQVLSMPVHNERADVYTIAHRQLFPEWGMKVTLDWNEAKVDVRVMTTLMRNVGTIGWGCYNVAKNGSYGLFEVVSVTDPHFYEV